MDWILYCIFVLVCFQRWSGEAGRGYSDWQELMTLTHLQHICSNQRQFENPGLHAARLFCLLGVVHGLQVLTRVYFVFLLVD